MAVAVGSGRGVGVAVGGIVGVLVAVTVGVGNGVDVDGTLVAVAVGRGVEVGILVGVAVAVLDAVGNGVEVKGTLVRVGVGVGVRVAVGGIGVAVAVAVALGTGDGVAVGRPVGVGRGVDVGAIGVSIAETGRGISVACEAVVRLSIPSVGATVPAGTAAAIETAVDSNSAIGGTTITGTVAGSGGGMDGWGVGEGVRVGVAVGSAVNAGGTPVGVRDSDCGAVVTGSSASPGVAMGSPAATGESNAATVAVITPVTVLAAGAGKSVAFSETASTPIRGVKLSMMEPWTVAMLCA